MVYSRVVVWQRLPCVDAYCVLVLVACSWTHACLPTFRRIPSTLLTR